MPEPPELLALPQPRGQEGGAGLLRSHQVPDGSQNDDREIKGELLREQETVHCRHEKVFMNIRDKDSN